jgi:hypothetical protein
MSNTTYGAGTDPLGLDTAKFTYLGGSGPISVEPKSINTGNGHAKQTDMRQRKTSKTLNYYIDDAAESDYPVTGSTVSGYLVLSVTPDVGDKHNTLAVQVESVVNITQTQTGHITGP